MTRAIVGAVTVAVVAAGAATAWWLAAPRRSSDAPAAVPVATAAVVRTTLSTTTQLSGTLGYSGAYTIAAQASGTITALPAPGSTIRRGHRLYEIDGSPVYLFDGSRPAWRPFSIGMTHGPDVRELEQNLTALGFGAGLGVDDTFTWGTEQAIWDWQVATDQHPTGMITLGRIAFAPTALRITTETATLGAVVQPGQPVLAASSPEPIVTMPVPATQSYLVHRGDRVVITVPSGATTAGRVVAISSVAAPAGDASQPNGPGGPQPATVPAYVKLFHRAVAAHLDQAPVTVTVTDSVVRDVLATPITALVALAGGGYAVWVDAAGTRHLVPVTPGLFGQTLVQVTAPGLHVGDRVEVPAQ
jgi:peptidoglycan hydrolase-like protein with peptidoglycan-binding domain